MGMQRLSPEAQGLVRFAWYWMATGLFIGIFMGLWSFQGPLPIPGFLRDLPGESVQVESKDSTSQEEAAYQVVEQAQYASVSRRLLRLGHIAFIALSIISILYAHFIDETRLSPAKRLLAIRFVKIGAVGIPTVCVVASFWLPFKWAFCIPGPSMTIGVFMLAWGLGGEPPAAEAAPAEAATGV